MMEIKTLDTLCEVVSGGTPSRSKREYWEAGSIPWIKISNIKSKYVNEADEFVTQAGLDGSSAKMLPKGTILYTIFATLGETGILNIDACTNQAIAGITIKDVSIVNTDYLYYYLKSKKEYVKNIGRGVAQNNINLSILRKLEVPVREMSEQINIVRMLDDVSKIIDLRSHQLLELDNLVKARFVEMFGNPVTNSKNMDELPLNDLGELGRGVSKHRPRNAPELLGGEYPLIQTGDVANAELYIEDYNTTYSEIGLQQSKMWKAGTLCITIAANIAKTAILKFDACFPDSVVGFNANSKTNNIFMHYWFTFFQRILEAQAPESAQKNINLKILSELNVIVPPIELQSEFVKFVQQIDKSKFVC